MTLPLWLLAALSLFGILHTYVVYPRWVVGAGRTSENPAPARRRQMNPAPEWPAVHVLMAVHNEEVVLTEKLTSLFASEYPGTLTFYVGSDNSSDRTNAILEATDDPRLRPVMFRSRQGKPGIINQLAVLAGTEGIFVITDASVMLRPDTITQLVLPMLRDPRTGVVDARMIHTGMREVGIGKSEELYIDREVAVKQAEGRWAGVMMGPFGGCWALRATAFRPVPDNFLVDDFYLCMCAYEQHYRGEAAGAALVYEGVGQEISEEFRRKVRISSGNWQNLVRFRKLWWPFWRSPLHFAFFSHKVLRWWTPMLLLLLLLSLGGLWLGGNYWGGLAFVLLTAGLLFGYLADLLFSSLGIHFSPLRNLRYFLAMNAALLVGFFRYLNGIKSNVWQPSTRH